MGYMKRKLSEEDYYLSLARRPRSSAVSQYRGVVKNSGRLPFRAQLTYQGRRFYLGVFETEIEAAIVYNRAALAIIGPHALINEIPDHDEHPHEAGSPDQRFGHVQRRPAGGTPEADEPS